MRQKRLFDLSAQNHAFRAIEVEYIAQNATKNSAFAEKE